MNLWAYYKCRKDHERKLDEFMKNARMSIYKKTVGRVGQELEKRRSGNNERGFDQHFLDEEDTYR